MMSTKIFTMIVNDAPAAYDLLRVQLQTSDATRSQDVCRDREWRLILLFLELYTFGDRFMDDEEFLGAERQEYELGDTRPSQLQASALSVYDVKNLSFFLKNLAFTMYYRKASLYKQAEQHAPTSISDLFGARASRQTARDEPVLAATLQEPFAGIAGMTFDYLRGIVTGALRMLYARDSRRRFLPKHHWLMTNMFDMEGFIPAVVLEEDKQRSIVEDEEESAPFVNNNDETFDVSGIIGMSRLQRARRVEEMNRRHGELSKLRNSEAVAPRLEVLRNMPFVIPFETRVQIFRQFTHLDQTRRRAGFVDPDSWRLAVMTRTSLHHASDRHNVLAKHQANIRREHLFEDALDQFWELGEGLKEPIQITFLDRFENVEAGIDGGGVTKEFLTSVTNEAFHNWNEPSLFTTNDQNLLYPNATTLDFLRETLKQIRQADPMEQKQYMEHLLKQYQFLGRVVGKCLYEGILIDINFAPFFLKKWSASGRDGSYRANLDDLRDLDESLYQGLLKLKTYPGDVSDFSLDFTITDVISTSPPKTITRNLMPGGADISVNNENRFLYIAYVVRHRLQVQPYLQTQAFLRGLGEIIEPSWLSMFNQAELQTLIGGASAEIDVSDLRANTAYGGIYQIGDDGEEHATVQAFWRVMVSMADEDRKKVLKFVTSTPRAPLLGFSALQPRFTIRDAGSDQTRLPSASTCVNLLKLPRYDSEDLLREKLLYAVNAGAGFDLS